MSYDFYSLVSSIKDKSSQAMATLSSDLMEFSTIVQEDVAEVAKTVRKTVHEKSEAFRQLAEQQRQEIEKEEHGETEETSGLLHDEEEEKEEEKQEKDEEEKDETPAASTVSTTASSLFSFASLSLEQVSSKLLHTADELLGALAGTGEGEEGDEDEDAVESARRYRLLALQEDPDTYTEPPMDVETFQKWRTSVSSDELASVQAEVLAHYPAVVEKLAELVPGTLSEEDFWAHYIYKASLLAAQEQRGADLLEHALNDSEEEVSWDADSPRAGAAEDATEKTFEAESTPAVPSIVDVSGADEARAMETASSDGESWIELDEQRRDAIQQPPLSSSSTSSFVPVVAQHDGVPASAPLQQHDEEDLTWGEDDEQIATATTTTEATESKPAAGVKTATASNRQGDDWGEWD